MIEIDRLKRFENVVASHPSLAKLVGPMCDLLTHCVTEAARFINAEKDNLGHLEEALRRPTAEFLRELLEASAQKKADACPPNCPNCGKKLKRVQTLERTVQTMAGEIKVKRQRGWCDQCEEWFIPADQALGLASGYSPHLQEMAALFASKMPVAEGSAVLERATGIKMPPATMDRVAKRVAEEAKRKRAQQDEQARLGLGLPSGLEKLKYTDTLILMIDAWNIRERDDWGRTECLRRTGKEPERWHWVYTGTVFRLEERTCKDGRPIIADRGFVATREGLPALTEQLHAEALRRGLGKVQRVLVMGDGAAWIWNLAADRFQEAVQRVDLYHIKEHLWAVARELHPDDPGKAKSWVKKMKNKLLRGQAPRMVEKIEQVLATLCPERQTTVQKEINHLKEHSGRMDYDEARKRGEPCGTGAIESTCRQYQSRFKRTGQFWTKTGDDGLLCIDTWWRNNRWSCLFPHTRPGDLSKN
jgi:hypothetical protein